MELQSKAASTNALFTIILGDFIARSSYWWKENNGRYTFGSTYILAQLSSAYIRTHTSTTSF